MARMGGLAGSNTVAVDGLTTIKSPHDATATMDRLAAAVKAKGLTVFARIDHAAGAVAVGTSLRPTAAAPCRSSRRSPA
jgi:uncharacterized protein (DUF302 family)